MTLYNTVYFVKYLKHGIVTVGTLDTILVQGLTVVLEFTVAMLFEIPPILSPKDVLIILRSNQRKD